MRRSIKILTGLAILGVTAGAAIVAYELFKRKFRTGCIYGGCHDENSDDIPDSCTCECDNVDYVDISSGEGIKSDDAKPEESCCVNETIEEVKEEPVIPEPITNEAETTSDSTPPSEVQPD